MTSEAEENKLWEGALGAKLTRCSPDQVWPLLEDFFNIHKITPVVDICYGIKGISGEPGCIRYCAKTRSTLTPGESDTSSEVEVLGWANEKLLEIDPVGKSLRYEILASNTVFDSLVATAKLLPLESGCEFVWSFTVKPIQGWSVGKLTAFYGSAVKAMAKRMEELLRSPEYNTDQN